MGPWFGMSFENTTSSRSEKYWWFSYYIKLQKQHICSISFRIYSGIRSHDLNDLNGSTCTEFQRLGTYCGKCSDYLPDAYFASSFLCCILPTILFVEKSRIHILMPPINICIYIIYTYNICIGIRLLGINTYSSVRNNQLRFDFRTISIEQGLHIG
jgi:hypothetical protein